MEIIKSEIAAVGEVVQQAQDIVEKELSELALSLVAGGTGDPAFM